MNATTHKRIKKKTIIVWLAVIVIAMFFFAYALVPLYNVLCNAFGINGKTNTTAIQNTGAIDKTRTITVQFLATNNARLPWKFKPVVRSIEIHPGQSVKIAYYAKNMTNRTMTVQAVPSVTPGFSAKYLKKTECFCFTQQTLKAHQAKAMPLIFHIDSDLPKNIHTITLSYTLFEAGKKIKHPQQRKGRL